MGEFSVLVHSIFHLADFPSVRTKLVVCFQECNRRGFLFFSFSIRLSIEMLTPRPTHMLSGTQSLRAWIHEPSLQLGVQGIQELCI